MGSTLITGATGFIGRRIAARVDRPVILTRDPARAKAMFPRAAIYAWNPQTEIAPLEAFRDVDTVFHLAGENVAQGRWTAARKQAIRDSRVQGTVHLVKTITEFGLAPRVLVSASAVGMYGDRGDELLDEASTPGGDFLAEVCRSWEAAALGAAKAGVRVVLPRLGLVIGHGGGALPRMLAPFRMGLGGRLGSGRQWMSWIHVDDLVELFLYAARTDGLSGPVNAVSPGPVTNAEFTATLARILGRPALLAVPGMALRLALGEFASVLLSSQRVEPALARAAGFRFRFGELEAALREALGRESV